LDSPDERRSELLRAAGVIVPLGLGAHAFFCPISIAATQIGLGVAAAGLVCAALAGWRPRRTPLDAPLLALALVALFSDVLSRHGPPPLAMATLWRSALGFWIVVQGLRLRPRLTPWLVVLAATGLALSSAVGLLQFRTGVDLVHALGLRAQPALVEAPGMEGRYGAMGFFISRLTFGHNATVLVSLLGGALAAGALPARLRWPMIAALLLGFAAILATFDRAAWLGLAAAALVIAALQRSGRAALLAAAGAAAAAVLLLPGVRARLATSFDLRGNADRVFIWSRAAEIIRDHPWLGIGFGNYPRVCGTYYDRVNPSFPMRTWAHNSELSMLAETGPLGLAALLWVAVAAVVALRRRFKEGYSLAMGGLAAGTALAVIAQVHDVFYDSKVMYALWLSLGVALGEAQPARREDGAGSRTTSGSARSP
jgi:O-antigen ligase